jgi:hypothetical protein
LSPVWSTISLIDISDGGSMISLNIRSRMIFCSRCARAVAHHFWVVMAR